MLEVDWEAIMRKEAVARGEEKPDYNEATLSILGYREEDQWVALALEMDLRGFGDTWDEAVDDLREIVLMQISFAHFKGQLEMIWRHAEEEYWDRFRQAQRSRLFASLNAERPQHQTELHAGGLVIPPAHVIAAHRDRFLPARG